jgi:hypothetical protein
MTTPTQDARVLHPGNEIKVEQPRRQAELLRQAGPLLCLQHLRCKSDRRRARQNVTHAVKIAALSQ